MQLDYQDRHHARHPHRPAPRPIAWNEIPAHLERLAARAFLYGLSALLVVVALRSAVNFVFSG